MPRWCVTLPAYTFFSLIHSHTHFLISIEGWPLHNHVISSSPPLHISFFLSIPFVSVHNNLIPGEDLSEGWVKEMCVQMQDRGSTTQNSFPTFFFPYCFWTLLQQLKRSCIQIGVYCFESTVVSLRLPSSLLPPSCACQRLANWEASYLYHIRHKKKKSKLLRRGGQW